MRALRPESKSCVPEMPKNASYHATKRFNTWRDAASCENVRLSKPDEVEVEHAFKGSRK